MACKDLCCLIPNYNRYRLVCHGCSTITRQYVAEIGYDGSLRTFWALNFEKSIE